MESSKSSENSEFDIISPLSTPTATNTSGSSIQSEHDSFLYCRTSSETSIFSYPTDDNSVIDESSPSGRSIFKRNQASLTRLGMKKYSHVADEPENQDDIHLELEMMKEKFSKLLLGEDMSGSGKGVCSAVAISNSITNLYATVFGQSLRLAPLTEEKKSMWRREMEYLLCVCDYIVEYVPSSGNLKDCRNLEVMRSRLRSDIYMNLPALKKLDNMLVQDILESFRETEFWYAEQGSFSVKATKSGSFRKFAQRKEEKWWLPVPCVPPSGLSEKTRKHLQHKRECSNQIHKAAMAINSSVLADMEVPDTYITTLPKSGKVSLGDTIYRYLSTTDKFSAEYILDCIDINSEHEALEIADKIEASIYIWKLKSRNPHSKSSWNVKDMVNDYEKNDKNQILASRAESLLFCLKQRYSELSQTSLDTSKIQENKDVGQAILESYSRVLEGLAFNIVSWIDDVLYVDDIAKRQ